MKKEFKVGDRVVPTEGTLAIWRDKLTKGKIYTVTLKDSVLIVYDDTGVSYWSDPENYFTKVNTEIYLGGE